MTSVVDKYYRRIIQNIDNVRMKSDISTLLIKSKMNMILKLIQMKVIFLLI